MSQKILVNVTHCAGVLGVCGQVTVFVLLLEVVKRKKEIFVVLVFYSID